MKFYLGVTDNNWFNYLSAKNPEDVNFWKPGGKVEFKVLSQGAPFAFKLKSPLNAVGGVGFYSSHSFLPISIAWETFGNRNGCDSFDEFREMILRYRQDKTILNPTIGCVVLNNPVFFRMEDWIPTPSDWGSSTVQGKSYFSESEIGGELWRKIEATLGKYLLYDIPNNIETGLEIAEPEDPVYGKTILTKVRPGQGAFRVLVTDAYRRRCAISGEKTLPVLEAAHIKPYSSAGPHFVNNGLLLRSDMHKLFDQGYLTVSAEFKIEVSRRIREEFENGKEYYKYHGSTLAVFPDNPRQRPAVKYLDWHNTNIFRP